MINRTFPLLCALLAAPAAPAGSPAPWPTERWPVAKPADQGLDASRLDELVRLIRQGEQFPDLHSLLIVRDGYLLLEEYFGRYGADDLHTIQSVSKSFTSAAMGIAIGQGKIKGVDEKILSFFPDLTGIQNLDDRKRAMTIEDLLTMRSGTDYHERGYPDSLSPHSQLNSTARGWDRFYLNRPMEAEPGTRFQYDSGGVILMSSLIKARTGQHADAFMEEHLFKPLGIKRWRWFRNAEGHPHTGGGLSLRPRDMAKLGLLYLRQGQWDGRQIVPAEWVAASTQRHVEFSGEHGRVIGYGYLWWILAPPDAGAEDKSPPTAYAAMGFQAQYIFVVPQLELVVVVTGGTKNGHDQRQPIQFLYTHILPAVGPLES